MRASKIFYIFIYCTLASMLFGFCALLVNHFMSAQVPQGSIAPPSPSLAPFLTSTLPPSVCVVTSEALNVRVRPSENSTAIYWLVQNDVVPILDDQQVGSWVRVQIADTTGWVNSHYCAKGK